MAMKRSTICAAVAVALAGGAMPARAWDIDWSLGLGYEHSDNIVRTAFDPISGNTITPFFDIAATEEGDTLRANIDYGVYDAKPQGFVPGGRPEKIRLVAHDAGRRLAEAISDGDGRDFILLQMHQQVGFTLAGGAPEARQDVRRKGHR